MITDEEVRDRMRCVLPTILHQFEIKDISSDVYVAKCKYKKDCY